MASFRQFVWDPALLVCQIICMQSCYYAIETSLMVLASTIGYEPSLSAVFSVQTTRFQAFCQLIASIGCAYALSIVVTRAKQCLDFAVTLHIFHIIFAAFYNTTFPKQFIWWSLQVISCTVCTVLGEYLCMRAESQEITLEGGPSRYQL